MAAPALEALLALQDLDTAIDQCDHRVRTLPERAELAELDAAAASATAARAEAAARRDAVAARQDTLEHDLAATEARVATVDRRLYSGEVSASRELAAMAADVAGLRQRVSDLEDELLGVLEERQPLDAAVDALDEQLAALAARQADAAAALARAEEALGAERADLAGRRGAAAAGVPADLLATYERLRARLGGVGAARLVNGRCDGCHLTLPATELDRIRHLPEDEVVTCDQCGRLLVRTGGTLPQRS